MKALSSNEVVAVRGVLTDTHPVDFYVLGVAGAIDRLTLPLRERGTVVHLEAPHHGMEVDRKSATLLYRAAQELLSNVHKYAQASAVTVCLGFVCHPALCHEVQLKVVDDGTGFDVQAATQGRHSGMGLRLMRLAVETVGGRMAIDSSSAGTSVNITLPLD